MSITRPLSSMVTFITLLIATSIFLSKILCQCATMIMQPVHLYILLCESWICKKPVSECVPINFVLIKLKWYCPAAFSFLLYSSFALIRATYFFRRFPVLRFSRYFVMIHGFLITPCKDSLSQISKNVNLFY